MRRRKVLFEPLLLVVDAALRFFDAALEEGLARFARLRVQRELGVVEDASAARCSPTNCRKRFLAIAARPASASPA